MTSSLVMRMHPDDIAWPIYSGWLVPWMRYRVSLLRSTFTRATRTPCTASTAPTSRNISAKLYHLHDFACGRDHQLPDLDHDEFPIGSPKVPENPDSLGLARSGEHCEVVGLRQRETGVQIRVCVVNREVVG